MNWRIPKLWKGGDVWIIGGGPSIPEQFGIPGDVVQRVLTGEETPQAYSPYLSYLHDKHVIGINVAYMMGDWVDAVFFGDGGFFLKHLKELALFPNLRVSCHPKVKPYNWVKFVPMDRKHRAGISVDNGCVSWNKNSGAAAISLAVHFGASRIYLLGFDMKVSHEKQHWHGLYRKNGAPNYPRKVKGRIVGGLPFSTHLKGFPRIAKDAQKYGVEIINVCPDSAIECFKKVSLKDIING